VSEGVNTLPYEVNSIYPALVVELLEFLNEFNKQPSSNLKLLACYVVLRNYVNSADKFTEMLPVGKWEDIVKNQRAYTVQEESILPCLVATIDFFGWVSRGVIKETWEMWSSCSNSLAKILPNSSSENCPGPGRLVISVSHLNVPHQSGIKRSGMLREMRCIISDPKHFGTPNV
jgi:hypothetical protein